MGNLFAIKKVDITNLVWNRTLKERFCTIADNDNI